MSRHFNFRLADDEPTVGVDWIMRRAGRRQGKHRYGPARQVAYLNLLISECGFPPPYPELVTGKNGAPDRLVTEVTPSSQFPRNAVEAWFEDYLPPASAAAIDDRARAAAAHDMDAAAGNLRLVS